MPHGAKGGEEGQARAAAVPPSLPTRSPLASSTDPSQISHALGGAQSSLGPHLRVPAWVLQAR